MVPDPVQSPTLDVDEINQADDLATVTSTLDLRGNSISGNETPEQTQARLDTRAQRISSGIRLTEREQFQMYKAETGKASSMPCSCGA